MSGHAIVSCLWQKNIGVLESYAKRHPGVSIIIPSTFIGKSDEERLLAAGGKVVYLEKLLPASEMDAVKNLANGILARTGEMLASTSWRSYCVSQGWDGERFAPILAARANAEALSFVVLLEALEQAKKQYEIALAVVNEDLMPVGRVVANWARNNGIPSLVVSHSLILFRPYTVHDTLHADVMALFGERGAEGYLDLGVEAKRLRVVGNPAWDRYFALKRERSAIRREVAGRLGLDAARPIVLFGTTWAANLSAFGDEKIYRKTLAAFFRGCALLRDQGMAVQPVIKDRMQNAAFSHDLIPSVAAESGFRPGEYAYTAEGVESLIVAADVVVSVESNMSVEAMMAGVPAINMVTEFGMRLGPCFDADAGIVESEPDELAMWLRRTLTDDAFRSGLLAAMEAKAPYYNMGVDGNATLRMVALMEELALPVKGNDRKKYIWQTLLNVSESDTNQYHNWCRSDLVEMFRHPPRLVLDIGCGAGATGEYIKKRYPAARVVGIEVNAGAARVAATRIDQVLQGKFEDFDLEAEGIRKGSIDTVIVADVLEHMYDPWGVMAGIAPYLTPDAQVVASIPNTRNLVLMSELADGGWTYDSWGLLDITHIRFFTLREIRRFFHETGYRIARLHYNMDSRLGEFYQRNKDKAQVDVDMGKLTIKGVSRDDLAELCTWQFYVLAEPGAVADEAFQAEEARRAGDEEKKSAYERWQEYRQFDEATAAIVNQRIERWETLPRIHLALLASPVDVERIGDTLRSLAVQNYQNLAVTVVSPAAAPSAWKDTEKLSWLRSPGDNLLHGVNQALLASPADWVGIVDAGDRLADAALVFLMEGAVENPAWQLIYSDEDVLQADGEYGLPHFKPDFNLDMLRSFPYVGGLLLARQRLFSDLSGFRPGCLGVEEYDLAFRAYEAGGEAIMGHCPGVLYHRRADGGHCRKPALELVESGRQVVAEHLRRQGIAAEVEKGLFPGSYRVRYRHEGAPLVSILAAVRDQVDKVQRLVETLLANTRYPNFELVLLNSASTSDAARAFLAGIQALGDSRLRVLDHPVKEPLPALHNILAGQARGDYLLFMYFDSAALQPDWLDSLMEHGRRHDVGAVGPKLLNADGTVRQTGIILGLDGSAGTVFSGHPLDYPGYFGRAHMEQDFSALGGGCLLTSKALFDAVGGFDGAALPQRFAEVDYCLRLREKGYRLVWTPHVSLLNDGLAAAMKWVESEAGEDEGEEEAFLRRHLKALALDPAYNPNLSLAGEASFKIETRKPLVWNPLPWRPLPRVLAQPGDSAGCGEYRIFSPMRALTQAKKIQGWADFHVFSPPEMERLDVDAIILQRQTHPDQVDAIARHKKYSRAFRVYELDDLITHVPVRNAHKDTMPKDVEFWLRKGVGLCDRFVVSTVPLAEAFRGWNPDIRVVPNFIEKARWGELNPQRRQGRKPRVGWAGGVGHAGDLEIITDVVKELAGEVEWVFLGMCPEGIRQYVQEFYPGVPIPLYPAKLASLNLDLALAPLELHPFNEGKSHLRLLEYGILGYPVVCTDIYPYQGEYPVKRVKNRHRDWVEAIRERINDLDACAREGDALREHVRSRWMLEDNLDWWMRGWLP